MMKSPFPGMDPFIDVPLDLQAVLNSVYDRARYDRSLDYSAELIPPLNEVDADWARETIESAS